VKLDRRTSDAENERRSLHDGEQQQQQHEKMQFGDVANEQVHQQSVVNDDRQQPPRQRDERDRLGRQTGLKLSQHPDCVDDVRKYCKRSKLHNFEVVECLQDDLEVSHVTISFYY